MTVDRLCMNEGCARRPEPGEDYCSACCLEQNLFRRDLRWSEPRPERAPEREAEGR